MQYRRANIQGGTYFFTVNLAERHLHLLVGHVDVLRDAVRPVKGRHPFYIDAFVVLPYHLHALWTLPPGDADFATRWGLIKEGFSRILPKIERCNPSRSNKGERGIWQRRYWEHLIGDDDDDYEKHVNYIHYNPVKHGHVAQASEWAYSSIHRYIAAGMIGRGRLPFVRLRFANRTYIDPLTPASQNHEGPAPDATPQELSN